MLEVPRIDAFLVKLFGQRHRHFVEDHVSFFSEYTLCRFLENASFNIIRVEYPTRMMSIRHFIQWLGTYGKVFRLFQHIPKGFLNKQVSISLRDIVCVYAIKE